MADLPVIDLKRCTLCGMCVDTCPEDVLAINRDILLFAREEQCTMCADCETVCPEGAVACHYWISWADAEDKQ